MLMLGALAALGVREGIDVRQRAPAVHDREAARRNVGAKWELMLPVVIVGSLLAGATTVQSAAWRRSITLIVQRFIQRDLAGFADLRRAMSHSIALVGGILIILAVAVGFTTYLIDAQVPARLADWARENIHSKWVFLLGLNAFLIVVGGLMDIFSSIIVVVPLDRADRGALRGRSDASRDHLRRELRAGLSDAAGGREPVRRVVSVQQSRSSTSRARCCRCMSSC